MDLERTIKPFVEEISQQFPVLLVCGMRQIGKSFLINKIKSQERKYISLDDLAMRKLATVKMKAFIFIEIIAEKKLIF
jgi:predicted AAA+ superfamily ATPase